MIRVTISHPRVAHVAFDHDYYFNRHLPLFTRRIGGAVNSITVDRGLSAPPWPDTPYEVVCSIVCESREAFEAAFFPHIEELQDDMDRCGGGPPLIQISDVVMDRWFSADMGASLRGKGAKRGKMLLRAANTGS